MIVEGPDAGKSFELPGASSARILIGQSSACAIRLTDPLVSRRHASLDVQGPKLDISDLGSRNGTYANEVAITEASLWGGEKLRLGGTTIRVEIDEGIVETPLSDSTSFGRVLGQSFEMRRLYPFFERLAQSDLPVIIEGETGTGKELLAESLHEKGPRASEPFIVFDQGQIAPDQVERALFGDECKDRPGVFEQAHGGTLLLDDVGGISPRLQKSLLRVLETHEVQRCGATVPRKVDVRVIASTRLNLDELVQDGTFREDLYYRLLVSRVELPPLRRRRGDIAMLVRHFWATFGGQGDPDANLIAQLERLRWPGNVRELRNHIARIVAFGGWNPQTEPVVVNVTPDALAANPYERVLNMDLPLARARELIIAEFERLYVTRVLAKHGGSVVKAAAASGLARRYFQLLRARRVPRT